ncbi:MAG: hypothetical protein DHS20C14_07410 [Phycisphaeraceae bacterium]|nr:MAG: hypothetical protein DHS20C14_07410 [Phycisphaeraceae bacterium]
MRNRTTITACCTLIAIALMPSFGAAPEPDNRRLHAKMEGMKENLKAIAITLRTPDAPLDDAFRPLSRLQAAVIDAKSMTPARVERLDEPERSAELGAYRAEQANLLIELCKMELALIEGDRDAAWGFVAGPLLEIRERAHERFQEP